MDQVDWYYIDADNGNAETGPLKIPELKNLFKVRKITLETYIWHDQADEWLQVKEMTYNGTSVVNLLKSEGPRPSASDRLAARKMKLSENISTQVEMARSRTQDLQSAPNLIHQQSSLLEQVKVREMRQDLESLPSAVEDDKEVKAENLLKLKQALGIPSAQPDHFAGSSTNLPGRAGQAPWIPPHQQLSPLQVPPPLPGMCAIPPPLPADVRLPLPLPSIHHNPSIVTASSISKSFAPSSKPKNSNPDSLGNDLQSKLQRALAERSKRSAANIEVMHKNSRLENSDLHDTDHIVDSPENSPIGVPRSNLPYSALDSKERMKQLIKSAKKTEKDNSDWSSSDSDVEESLKPEKKALALEETSPTIEGWVEEITLEGQVYYRNAVTSEVRWEIPKTCLNRLSFDNSWVWIPHPQEAFVPAKLIQANENGEIVVQKVGETSHTKITGAEAGKCVPLNKTELSQIPYVSLTQDLIHLAQPTDPLLLHVLRSRFIADKIYTRIGGIIIAVNPFKPLPLYTEAYVSKIKSR